ncbi:MAG TPA: DUF1259 domain-containing protein [Gemmatimonadales bacterium]|nr:DUF1259 domain-containing protein [Gemmatimonadales bacterium]
MFLAAVSAAAPAAAQGPTREDPRWEAIRRVFGQPGSAEGRYFRVELPRRDLHVRIGGDALAPRFEFTSYLGFLPVGNRDVMAMGEVILRDDEVPAALAAAHRQGVSVTAVHNHLLGETPRIVYVHVRAEGETEAVATKLRAVFAATATPLEVKPEGEGKEGARRPDWSAIDSVLGPHAEAEENVAEYVFPRRERLTVHGRPVESSGTLETASEVVFQQLAGGRMAVTGELFLLPSEVDAVTRTLDEHGLHVTAVHNHMLDETPRMYWVHWYAAGDGPALARGVAAALAHTNGARRSAAE